MNKKIALVTLIRHSLIFPDETKIELIESIPSFNDRQVEALGMFLAKERDIALESEKEILAYVDTFLQDVETYTNAKQHATVPARPSDDAQQIYIGSGKP